jgi:hypothetical protein
MALTQEAPAAESRIENVGRIEAIRGVVIEAVFPGHLPEINHAIKVRRTSAPRRTTTWSARCSSNSVTTTSGLWRWTAPTAWRAEPR